MSFCSAPEATFIASAFRLLRGRSTAGELDPVPPLAEASKASVDRKKGGNYQG